MGNCQSSKSDQTIDGNASLPQSVTSRENASPSGRASAAVKKPVAVKKPKPRSPTQDTDDPSLDCSNRSTGSSVCSREARRGMGSPKVNGELNLSQRRQRERNSNTLDSSTHSRRDRNNLDGSRHRRRELDGSRHSTTGGMVHSTSVVGLHEMIEDRRDGLGTLTENIVHIEVPFGKSIDDVYDGVHTGKVLGSGISGIVREVTHKSTSVKYAVKCLDLGLVETEDHLQQLREEIYIMCQLDHPNIVRLEEVYESHNEIYLVQELCVGGELFDRLDEQPDYHYTEHQCARLVKQILSSVRYIHSKGIIHRDLKLENFLFSSTHVDSELKMIDFGLSKHFKFGEQQHEAVGTPYTVAPEVIRGSYDEKCDVWAIGVITYLLLSGDPPFGGCGGPEPLMTVRNNILKGSFKFEPDDVWADVSNQARDFIKSLLVTDPKKRPLAYEAQRLPWLKEWAVKETKEGDNRLSGNVVKALVSFKENSDMRKLLLEVISFTLLPDQIHDLRREFEKLDTEGSGEITLNALKKVLMDNAGAGSLGSLTEEEVEDIFNAMRVSKSEATIHWHEFLAAGLSQCKVDDRNLRLAFERLDSEHKGFISFDNVLDLLGSLTEHEEESIRIMYKDSLAAVRCYDGKITYDDFLMLMKGQDIHHFSTLKGANQLDAVPELGASVEAVAPLTALLRCGSMTSEDGTKKPPITPPASPMKVLSFRPRAKSMDIEETPVDDISFSLLNHPHIIAPVDSRRGIALPEHDHEKNVSELIKDGRQATPLVVNRTLYRAHREMRLTILEASKRFEEKQMTFLMKELGNQKSGNNKQVKIGAGLVMRKGTSHQMSTEAVRKLMKQKQEEQQAMMEKASSKSGRGKRRRKKTVSDMTGMLGGPPADMPRQSSKPIGLSSCPPSPAINENSTEGSTFCLPFLPAINLPIEEGYPPCIDLPFDERITQTQVEMTFASTLPLSRSETKLCAIMDCASQSPDPESAVGSIVRPVASWPAPPLL